MDRRAWIEVDMMRLKENIQLILKINDNFKLYGVVKANGYGHGVLEIARAITEYGVDTLAVESIEEGLFLRKYLSVPILVLGYTSENKFKIAAENDLTLSVCDYFDYEGSLKVEVQVDTGMNRLGLKTKEEVEKYLKFLQAKKVTVEGIFSHLAVANSDYYRFQLKNFLYLTQNLTEIDNLHLNNSLALKSARTEFKNARIGLLMYGIDGEDFKQIISIYSQVTAVKYLKKGEYVGYNNTLVKEAMYLAIVSVGYADGFNKRLEQSAVIINQKTYQIFNSICMDQMMVKVDQTVKKGDLVTLVNDQLTILRRAKECQMIPYEFLCNLSDRLDIIYRYKEKKVVHNYRFNQIY